MTVIPWSEYLPDQPAFANPGLVRAQNVIPKPGGRHNVYGPFPAPVVASDALGARCQGAGAIIDYDGNVYLFAGDVDKLYLLTDGSFGDVSVGGGYSTTAAGFWNFAAFGERFMATNFADAIQTYLVGTDSAFSVLDSGAPKAKYMTMVDPGFLLTGHTNDTSDGTVANRVWWSAFNDPTDFPTIGSADAKEKQSDFNDMHSGGWVMGVVGAIGGAAGAIVMEKSIFRMDYVGPDRIFNFREIERSRGTPCPNSIANVGPFMFYYAEDGFRMFDGAQSIPIGDGKVDMTFQSDLDNNYLARVYGRVDPANKLYYVLYPGSGNSSGVPNKGLIYHWEERRWSEWEHELQVLVDLLSTGYTLDGLDALGYNLDTLPFSLDSRVWAGGRQILGAFDSDNKLNFFTGGNKAARLETGDLDESNMYQLWSGIRPLFDGGSPTAQVGYRDDIKTDPSYTTASVEGADGYCPAHISTRYGRARVNMPADESWENAFGFEPRIQNDGER